MTNLVMGAAKGYGWDVLEPFVTSCKRHCPDAEIVLFIGDISDFTRDKLIREGATLINITAKYSGVLIVNSRFEMYADFLETYGADYEQVFLCDIRDVIFQADIFAPFAGLTNWLGLATEADDIRGTKTSARMNYDWIRDCFGAAEADKLADQKIICCGTIIGSCREIEIFCRELWKIVRHNLNLICDQAVTNYLAWNGLLPIENVFELDVDGSEIFTAGLFTALHPIEIRDDKILRGDGQIPAVVHQYDRHDALVELVDRIYRDRNFQADPRFNDAHSTFEQATCLLSIDNVEAAAKLFIGKLFVAEDLSGCIETLMRLWEKAMLKPLTKASGDIELAVQAALKTINPFPSNVLEKICFYLKISREKNHLVDSDFAEYLTRSLLHAAQQTAAAGEIDMHNFCMYLLKILGVESEATR